MKKIIPAICILWLCLMPVLCFSQDNEWVVGEWKGGYYGEKSKLTKKFDSRLQILKVYGTMFEGVVQCILPGDTTIRLHTRISGRIYPNYLMTKLKEVVYFKDPPGQYTWAKHCFTCDSMKLTIAKRGDSIVLSGERKCDTLCNIIARYSKSLANIAYKTPASKNTSKGPTRYDLVMELAPESNTLPPGAPQVRQNGATASTGKPTVQQGTTSSTGKPTAQQGTITSTSKPTAQQGTTASTGKPTDQQGTITSTSKPTAQQGTTSSTGKPTIQQGATSSTGKPQTQQTTTQTNSSGTNSGAATPAGNPPIQQPIASTNTTGKPTVQQGTTSSTGKPITQQGTTPSTVKPQTQPSTTQTNSSGTNSGAATPASNPTIKQTAANSSGTNSATAISTGNPATQQTAANSTGTNPGTATPANNRNIQQTTANTTTPNQAIPASQTTNANPNQAIPTSQTTSSNQSIPTSQTPPEPLGHLTPGIDRDNVYTASMPTRSGGNSVSFARPMLRDSLSANNLIAGRNAITSGRFVVNVDSAEVILMDNGWVDGDSVSLYYNGQVIVQKIGLSTKPYSIKIPVYRGGANLLTVYAESLGSIPPNTAYVRLICGKKETGFLLSSNLSKSSSIEIFRSEANSD